MRTRLEIERLLSWMSAGRNRLASFSAFLGGNSAGKTGPLQCFWMLKRTADELPERLPREGQAAHLLKDLGLIARFATRPITAHSTLSQTVVRRSSESPAALIADAGFGVSLVLPVISLCSYAPVGATFILEQPEIYRHPGVRSDLADGLVDAVKARCISIVLESGLHPHDVALCFCTTDEQGTSQIQPLEIELYAAVANRTKDFFGDEMTDLLAMTQTAMKRRCEEGVGALRMENRRRRRSLLDVRFARVSWKRCLPGGNEGRDSPPGMLKTCMSPEKTTSVRMSRLSRGEETHVSEPFSGKKRIRSRCDSISHVSLLSTRFS